LDLLSVADVVLYFYENFAVKFVVASFPRSTAMHNHLSGVFTLFKWVFISSSFVVLVVLIGMALTHALKTRRK
jgi:hypothetical protein